MLLPILYSEVHYHLKYFYPRYFKKEPEILFDLPTRVLVRRTQKKIPIFLLVKDAERYPTTVDNICVNVSFDKERKVIKFDRTIVLDQSISYHEFHVDIEPSWVNKDVYLTIDFQVNKNKQRNRIASYLAKTNRYTNDNYFGSIVHEFKVHLSDKDRFFPDNWYIGDVHYHSSFTSDQVEFGAPLEMTKKIAYAMGVDWLFVTDHSYDLDDMECDFLVNDPNLSKWSKMKEECERLSLAKTTGLLRSSQRQPDCDENVQIQFGEEVSIGNEKGQNVHLLSVNNPCFIQGKGDSAEKWFRNKPDEMLRDVCKSPTLDVASRVPTGVDDAEIAPTGSLMIAAHPFEKIPLLQRLLLNRGTWSQSDIFDNGIEYLQIINGQSFTENMDLINKYLKLLLTGKKLFIVAGNDAHGNFQYMKQIKIPFWKLMCRKQQIFGDYFTAFFYHENKPIEGLKNKRIVVSNGPFLDMSVEYNNKIYHIGETILGFEKGDKVDIKYKFSFSEEHGEIDSFKLIHGNKEEGKIDFILVSINDFQQKDSAIVKETGLLSSSQRQDGRTEFATTGDAYILLLLTTKKGYMAMTNPIWVDADVRH